MELFVKNLTFVAIVTSKIPKSLDLYYYQQKKIQAKISYPFKDILVKDIDPW
jgi:hypothetical protein